MNEQHNSITNLEERQKLFGLWAARIFTIIGLAFFGYSAYTLFFIQQGQAAIEDQVLLPITILMFVVSAISFFLIRGNRFILGIWLLVSANLIIPSILAVLVLRNIYPVVVTYLITLTAIMVFQVFPRASRWQVMIAAVMTILAIFGIELWNPVFRGSTANLSSFTAWITILASLGFLALFIRSRAFLSGLLGNISFAWKMVLMASVLFLGTLGVAGAAYSGLQSLRYQLSNIYDFMLIPIVAIGNADTALADAQYLFENLNEVKGEELSMSLESIQAGNKLANDIITRYETEWVTTVSPEFTQALEDAGKLELQQQEIAAMESSRAAFDSYTATSEKYFATVQAGHPDDNLANDTIGKLQSTRTNLQTLIDINNIYADFSNTEAQAAFRQALLNGGIVLIIGLVLGLFMSYLVVISITSRLSELTRSATTMQEGNLDQTVTVVGRDEVSLLGTTFNKMAAQLREFIGTLEGRVAERTQSLELAAEVGRSVSQVRALDVMLKDAAELIRSRFDLYYVQVYLTDPGQTNLILQSGTGTVGAELTGRGHSLPLNTASINGRAAAEKRSVVVEDTVASAAFRPNPLLPDTRSEMAVPLLIGEKVVGVLDLQSREAGALNQDILTAFEALAGQLAIAIQNATFLAETQQARAEVEAQTRRLTRANWEEYMDAIHQPEEIGFLFEQNKIMALTEDQQIQTAENSSVLVASIAVTGEALGNLIVEMEGDSPIARTNELINTVARQVSQQIENLRLLENAERYRAEAEGASRRITREGWKDYTDANAAKGLSYIYDLKEVRPLKAGDGQAEKSAVSLPLKVRDETVGKLVIQGLGADDSEALELASAVAERLGAHIENLRLSEQTQERAQREHALRQITSAVRGSTDPATILRAAVRELGTLLGRKTVIRLETAREVQASQTDFIANSGDETVLPAGSPNAVGGDE